jgi:hypothetical protein
VVVAAALVAVVSLRRRTHDDEHSVQGYHRQLHTLEVLRDRQGEGTDDPEGEPRSLPESALRVSSHSTVRLTQPGQPVVPPVPPPPVADPTKPVTFDDGGTVVSTPTPSGAPWHDDKALHGINRRPRRLAAPAAAVAAVAALIVILLITGTHSNPPHKGATAGKSTSTSSNHSGHHSTGTTKRHHSTHATTTTTGPPIISLPQNATFHDANYALQLTSYQLAMSATSAECWVEATETGTGHVLFSGVIDPGQTQTVSASGDVDLVIGAPGAFAANVDGTSVTFPYGFLAPFTMHFQPATATSGTGSSTATTSSTTTSSTTTTSSLP